VFVAMVAVDHVRAASEPHHEIKESREEKKLEYPRIHRCSKRSPRVTLLRLKRAF
jgi:hypothetical protein